MSNVETVDDLKKLRGLVATVVLTGSVKEDFAQHLANVRSWCDRNGFHSIEWRTHSAQLVEEGRDSVCRHALNPSGDGSEEPYDWVLQIDADAAPMPADAVGRILKAAYIEKPASDVLGAYAQLKHPPYLPTIDTGTGTWEPHFPGEGLLEVIRTGGHFLLVKTPILQRFGPPWFRTRRTTTPAQLFAELDNYARVKLSGENPLSEHESWSTLLDEATADSPSQPSSVGEDSGFCDAVKAAGGRIFVDTRLVIGHVGTRIIGPGDLRDALRERRRRNRLAVGVYE